MPFILWQDSNLRSSAWEICSLTIQLFCAPNKMQFSCPSSKKWQHITPYYFFPSPKSQYWHKKSWISLTCRLVCAVLSSFQIFKYPIVIYVYIYIYFLKQWLNKYLVFNESKFGLLNPSKYLCIACIFAKSVNFVYTNNQLPILGLFLIK